MMPTESADELRTRIARYKLTRHTSARSMHRWLDGLIADAEKELHRLAHTKAERPPTPPAGHPLVGHIVPFDEHMPRQPSI